MYAGNFLSLTSIYYLFLFRVLRVLYHWSCTNLLRTQLSCPSLCHRKVPSLVYSSSPSLMGSADPSASHHSIIASHPPPPGRLLAFTTRPCEPSVWQKCIPLYLAMTSSSVISAPWAVAHSHRNSRAAIAHTQRAALRPYRLAIRRGIHPSGLRLYAFGRL